MTKRKTISDILNLINLYKKWVILLVIVFAANLFVVLINYPNGIGMGDGSTFYSFARNFAAGEVFYQDFIHFRTPGSYALFALAISLLGDAYANFNLALLVESRVLYPIAFLIAFMFLFSRKYFVGAVFAAMLLFVLPEYAQLRTVLALLAVAILTRGYIATIGSKKKHNLNRYLAGAGVITGLSFIFGQEAGLMAGSLSAVMILAFAFRSKATVKSTIKQYLWFGSGFIVGLLPLLIYVLAHGQIFNFLYYTFYYALIRQPQFMDLPFPSFGYSNFVYYLPFLMILVAVLLLGALKNNQQRIALGIFVAFAILRLATHLGRTDIGHLLFVVPELVLAGVMSYALVAKGKEALVITRNLIITLIITLGVFAAVLSGASSMLLLIAASAVTLYTVGSLKDIKVVSIGSTHVLVVGFAFTFLFLFLMAPHIKGEIGGIKADLQGNWSKLEINGSRVDKDTYETITKVEEAVAKLDPTTIYSYPILPYFYSLAERHATSFMTYEPQTTVDEQKLSIQQLMLTKPEVIVMDPAQATSMSGSLWLINQYIMENYEITETIVTNQVIWILQPKSNSATGLPLALTKYFSDQKGIMSVQSPQKSLNNGLMFSGGEYSVLLEGDFRELQLTYPQVDQDGCILVKLTGQTSIKETRVCNENETYYIKLDEPIKSVDLSTTKDATVYVLDSVIVR